MIVLGPQVLYIDDTPGQACQIEILEIRSLKKKNRSFSEEFFFQIRRKIRRFSLKV